MGALGEGKRSRVILGLDPGLAFFGYGVIATDGETMRHLAHGCISTDTAASLPLRLRAVHDQLNDIKAHFAITDVAVETLFYSRNTATALAVGQARGAGLLATVDESTSYAEYSPTEVKQIVAGFGAASKRQIQEMVALILQLPAPPEPDDAADALAVAICHVRRSDFEALIEQSARATFAAPSITPSPSGRGLG